jgi:hypothetical protein
MSSPALSCSGTVSAPRSSTQHGTLPLSNWCGTYQRRKSAATSAWPRRISEDAIIAPSRIHERAYERVPGRSAAPSRVMRMWASEDRIVSTRGWAAAGTSISTRLSLVRHARATASRSRPSQSRGANRPSSGAVAGPDRGTTTPALKLPRAGTVTGYPRMPEA